jgi:murein DD-endopeptidase MepM/ murein hydrolase activator NlpD
MRKMKGKISAKRRNYLSFMFVPHNKGNVKTIRISNYRTTLLSITAIMLVALLTLTGYTLSVVRQNKELKILHAQEIENIMAQKKELEDFIADQTQQLIENSELIAAATASKTISEEAINQYKTEYENLVVSYVDKNMSTIRTVSRGSSKEASFKDGLAELRALINLVQDAKLAEDDVTSKIAKKEKELVSYLDSLPTFWPIDSMKNPSSSFGMRRHPIFNRNIHHDGIDIGSGVGSPIYAAGAGKVIQAGWNGGYGNCITISHGNGFKTVYGHLSKIEVKAGDWVKKGQKIGKMGNTGNSTSSHLHFEIRINDIPADPLKFLEKR